MKDKVLKEILKELYKAILLNEINKRAVVRKIERQPDLKEAFGKSLIDLEQELEARQNQLEIVKEMQNEKN